MRRCMVLVAIPLLAASCHRRTAPERAVADYSRAILKGDCAAAWSMLSSDTQQAFEFLARQRSSQGPDSAQTMACNRAWVADWRPRRMRSIPTSATRATVVMKRAERGGMIITHTTLVDEPIEVVLENGAWRVEVRQVVARVNAERRAEQSERAFVAKEQERSRRATQP